MAGSQQFRQIETTRTSSSKVYEFITHQQQRSGGFEGYHEGLLNVLRKNDPATYELIRNEYERLTSTLQLIAAENQCSRAVLAALGSVVQNKTTEGFAGARFHGGCEVVDQIENLAIERAQEAFGAKYANVQPHSGTQANQIVINAILEKGDNILSLSMAQGGHVSHGESIAWAGRHFEVEHYCVSRQTFLLDYDQIRLHALKFRPKLIICGASAYPRTIDFAKFRSIADEIGAYLMADVSHIAGLVMAGAHPSPIDEAHFTTSSTYKPGGPRGGIILMGRDFDTKATLWGKTRTLAGHIQKATFPGVQGTPYLNHIAAKAVFFKECLDHDYRRRQFAIIANAKTLAAQLKEFGFDVVTGDTDTHMVLINIANFRNGLTGAIAQNALEQCGIVVNMNKLPYDPHPASVASGIRLGTPIVTRQGMGDTEMRQIAAMLDEVLRNTKPKANNDFVLDDQFAAEMRTQIRTLCGQFRII